MVDYAGVILPGGTTTLRIMPGPRPTKVRLCPTRLYPGGALPHKSYVLNWHACFRQDGGEQGYQLKNFFRGFSPPNVLGYIRT
jgi:hypothetical protein